MPINLKSSNIDIQKTNEIFIGNRFSVLQGVDPNPEKPVFPVVAGAFVARFAVAPPKEKGVDAPVCHKSPPEPRDLLLDARVRQLEWLF